MDWFFVLCWFLWCIVSSLSADPSTFMKCYGHPDEMTCFGPTKEYCYFPWQRCDGEANCPHSHLADECLCEMYCDSMTGYKYCKYSDICIPASKMCPATDPDATVRPPIKDECPSFAPHSCWRVSKSQRLTTYPKTCYTDQEKCDGKKDCSGGEDEIDCDKKPSSYLWLLVTVGLIIVSAFGIFFLLRRWMRKRRLRRDANDNDSADVDVNVTNLSPRSRRHGQMCNPDLGLPPPCYPGEPSGSPVDVAGELPPPYVLQPPSNNGPQSVLPTYNEAISSKSHERF